MRMRLFPVALLAAGLASTVLAGNETGKFFVVRTTGYFGETTNAVMTDVQLKKAFAEANDYNQVAVAAYAEFCKAWNAEQQKAIEAQKKAANGKKVEIDRSLMNIVLDRPGRRKVQPGEPFVARKDAEAELAALAARETSTLDDAAPKANAAGGASDVKSFLRGQQLAMFLGIADKMRKASHDSRGDLQGGGGHTTRMGANSKKLLTGKPPPLERPAEKPVGGDAPPKAKDKGG